MVHLEVRADPCEIPAAAGLPPDGEVVGLDDSAGNWKQIAVACLLLSGCEATLPEVRIVKVPVTIACIKEADIPTQPTILENSALQKLDDHALVLRLATERLELLTLSKTQSALIQGCR